MFTTITLGSHVSAQGIKVQDHADGRVTISTGTRRLTGWPVARLARGGVAALPRGAPQAAGAQRLLNVGDEPARELYCAFNAAFHQHWTAQGNPAPIL